MKIKRIQYSRSFSQNYQTYRAGAEAELEDWETNIDASYAALREIVREQIGKQCEKYTGVDSDEILPLKEAIDRLQHQNYNLEAHSQYLNREIAKKEGWLEKLEHHLQNEGMALLKDVINVLRITTPSDLKRFEHFVEEINKFALSSPIRNSSDITDDDEDDDDNPIPM